MIHSTPFVVVDLETTGLEPRLDHIIEIGAVKIVNGEIVAEWDALVNPGIFIPHETSHYTGITTEMVKDSPAFLDLADEFLEFLGADGIFVAHNADFDHEFVQQHLQRHERTTLHHPYLCTLKMAKRVHPNLNSYALGNLAKTFEVDLPQAHRALHDARATAHLLIKFLNTLQGGGMKNLKDLPGLQNLPQESAEQAMGQVSLF